MLPASRRTGRTISELQGEIDEAGGDGRRSAARGSGCCARNRASRRASGAWSMTISTKSAPPMPVPDHADRALVGRRASVTKASRIRIGPASRRADRTVRATSGGVVGDREEAPRRRRDFTATARAPTPARSRASRSSEQLLGRRGVEHESGDLRRGEPVVQPVAAEIGDRGHVDQHLRHHHEQDGEQEEARRQAEGAGTAAPRGSRPGGDARVHGRERLPEARARTPMTPAQPAGSAPTAAGTRPPRASRPPTGSDRGRRGRRGPAP